MVASDSILIGGTLAVGLLLGMIALGVSLAVARHLSRLRQQLDDTREVLLARLSDTQRQRTESMRIDVFVRAVESVEASTRALITYSQLLAEHATSVVFDSDDTGFRQTAAEITALRTQAEKAGLFLPPELDRPYQRAFKTVVGVQVAAEAALRLPGRAERKELCRPAVVAMDQEVLTFLNTSRVWKKRKWFQATTGEEAAPDAFADATSPALMRPRGLLREDGALER
ncbi:MAG TPA: hypothetical protein PLU22_08490 [Polyangiaceae bacterium]|nr:hypothetical protein [Polyangiaceae bacterium]